MVAILEFIAPFVFELLLPFICELGARGLLVLSKSLKSQEPRKPWVTACGYAVMGGIAGAVSLWFFPSQMLQSSAIQIINLLITSVLLGGLFEGFGRWKTNRGRKRYPLDRFSFGFVFAFAMGLIRYVFAA